MSEKPIILIGSAHDAGSVGDGAANGGVKLQNVWGKLLRQHGYDSYLVTFDGSKIEWMIDHIPYISVEQARHIKAECPDTRVLTTWFWSNAMFSFADRYYLFDAELAFTSEYHAQRGILEQHLQQNRIIKLGTHSRTMQAWYMATYGFAPDFIQEWSDTAYWKPAPDKRIPNRIGFMDEGKETFNDIELIRLGCQANGLTPEFVQIGGTEAQVLDLMQSCDLFLGLGRGKHPLWGEGCNRSGQEAMHAGCVVLMYDQHGNREYMFDDWNGYIVPSERTDLLTKRIVRLLRFPTLKENLRWRSVDFAVNYFAPEKRWNAIADFLDLETERT